MKFWKTAVGRYALSVLLGVDQLANVAVFSPLFTFSVGNPDETISSRVGRIKVKNGGKMPKWRLLTRALDWGLEKVDPGHCIDAIEWEGMYNRIHYLNQCVRDLEDICKVQNEKLQSMGSRTPLVGKGVCGDDFITPYSSGMWLF